MSRIFLIFLFVLLFTLPLLAQSVDTAWVRRYNGPGNGDDEAHAIAVDNSGNVYVTGQSFDSSTGHDYLTIKYHPKGGVSWMKRYDGPANSTDIPHALAVDDSGNVYVTGYSFSSVSDYGYATIKYYPNGDTAWVRRYDSPSSVAYAIALDNSGNVYVTGRSYIGIATVKYYSNGDFAWVRRLDGSLFPPSSSYWAFTISVDFTDNVYVGGGYREWFGGYQWEGYLTLKYYSNGDPAWSRGYETGTPICSDIEVDSSGYIFVTGRGPTIKYDTAGTQSWVGIWGGADLALDGAGNVYVTETSGGDYLTVKYYSNGDTAWLRTYNGTGNGDDQAYAIAVDGSGNIYVTGYSAGIGAGSDYATIKYDTNGNKLWVQRYNGSGNSTDQATAISVDDSGDVYITGKSFGSETDYDYATIKYVQFLRGDANKDGEVIISDIVYLINYLYKQGPEPIPAPIVGDANCDVRVSLSDIVYLIAYLYKEGPPPCV